jgi:alkylation response protein AidB-like acyl-CoA dehydrogenase
MDTTLDPLVSRLAGIVRARLAAAAAEAGPASGTGSAADRAWLALREVDAPAFEAPVGVGGYDLGLTSGVTVAVELGRQALPDVYSAVAATMDALDATGSETELARELCAGRHPVRLAGADCAGTGRPARLSGRPGEDGWVLDGRVTGDADAGSCAWLAPFEASDGIRLALLDPGPGPARPAPGRPGFTELAVSGLELDAARVPGRLGSGWPLSDPDGVLARLRIRQAAYLLGLASRASDLGVRHASRRRQFGQPLLDFQAVAFPLARSAVALRAVWLTVHRAAWLADAGQPARQAAAEALALAAETAMTTARRAMQACGARGMTLENPVHACYLLARREGTRLGSPDDLWREAGARRITPAADSSAGRAALSST